jgi:hypothetical protein
VVLRPAGRRWDELLPRIFCDANLAMRGNDFSELMLYRALEQGRATDAQAREFLTKLYPGNLSVYAERQQRLANLVTVRATTAFRRPPGSTPVGRCGGTRRRGHWLFSDRRRVSSSFGGGRLSQVPHR